METIKKRETLICLLKTLPWSATVTLGFYEKLLKKLRSYIIPEK